MAGVEKQMMFRMGLAGVLLGAALGCTSSSDSTVALYAFDGSSSATNRVLIWDDVSTLYADETTSPTRTLSGTLLDKVSTLGWGGMCLDPQRNRLYLVSTTGYVTRIERIRSQSGALSSTSDIVCFRLGSSSERLSSGVFGQASVDTSTGVLYVTESTDSEARVWKVDSPGSYASGDVVSLQAITVSSGDDAGGTGVAAVPGGSLYAYFEDGAAVVSSGGTTYTGARIRLGTSSGFSSSSLVIGSTTALGKYGSLAYDSGNSRLYVARHNTDSGITGAPILAFTSSQFSSGYGAYPAYTFGSSSTHAYLRAISHAGSQDWLGGVISTGTTPTPTYRFWLWKDLASGSTTSVAVDLDSAVAIRGLAFDPNA